MSSNEEHPGVKMVQKGEIRKEEDRKCPADDDESSELKYNLQIPEARSFSKMDEIEYFDKLPWIFGALGRSLTLNLKSRPPFFAPINIPLSRRLQTFAVLFWMSSFLILTSGGAALLLYLFFFTQYWWISLCYLTWYLADLSICHRGGRRANWFRELSLWKYFRDFFPIHLIKTAELDPSKNYIMGYHPHGILSAGAIVTFGTEALNFSKMFPGLIPYMSTLEVQFFLPFFREYLLLTGAVCPSRESIDYIMKRKQNGQTVILVIGGAKESLECRPGRADIFLKDRKGFCKIALKYGSSLVPVFSFGENDIYDQLSNPPGSLLRRLQTAFQDIVGFSPLVFFGRGVFQYGFGIVPFRKPINIVVGSAIDVPKVENPTQEEIDSLHESYVKALVELYNKYRGRYSAYPEVDIKII